MKKEGDPVIVTEDAIADMVNILFKTTSKMVVWLAMDFVDNLPLHPRPDIAPKHINTLGEMPHRRGDVRFIFTTVAETITISMKHLDVTAVLPWFIEQLLLCRVNIPRFLIPHTARPLILRSRQSEQPPGYKPLDNSTSVAGRPVSASATPQSVSPVALSYCEAHQRTHPTARFQSRPTLD